MAHRIAVVISQGQSRNPAKRQLEEDLVTALIFEPGLDVTVIPNLYDLTQDGTGMLALQGVKGPMIVVSWLFPRAAHWTLDRNDICGQVGPTLLVADEDDDEELDEVLEDQEDDKERVIAQREIPLRKIYCIDFRASELVDDFVGEIKRIAKEVSTKVVEIGELGAYPSNPGNGASSKAPTPAQQARFKIPTNDTALTQSPEGVASLQQPAPNGNGNGDNGNGDNGNGDNAHTAGNGTGAANRIDESPGRRWYPVIDYSQCTNCMECIDFCLFGVYGVDAAETILVELPDNCRKGCPACSRVCPENAIIFPQHKTPTIAGAPSSDGGLKIDLSMLFGKPDALNTAADERDEQLMLSGRDAVGMSVGMPKRQAQAEQSDKDDLDDLIDELDELDL